VIPGRRYSPEDVMAIAWRARYLLLVCAIVGSTIGYAVSFGMPKQYKSQTRILVVPQRVPDSYVRSTVTARIEDRLSTISHQILSRTRLESIINEFNLYADERATVSMDELIARMKRKAIEVELERGSAFRVAFISSDPQTAQLVASRLAGAFIEENLRDREVVAEGTTAFLDNELQDALQRLVTQEKKLEEYRRAYAGELPSQLGANQQAAQNAQMQLQAVMQTLNADRDRRAAIEREIADLNAELAARPTDPIAAVTPGAAAVPNEVQQLAIARSALADLTARYTRAHPDVQRAERRVRELEGIVARLVTPAAPGADPAPATTRGIDVVRQNRLRQLTTEVENLRRQIAYSEQEESRLRGTLQTIRARIEATPTRDTELVSLSRDYETLKKIYETTLAKKEESRMAANLETRQIGEQFRILDPATVPGAPFSPNRLLFALVGAMLLNGLAAVLLAFREYRNATLRSEEEVLASIGLPVVAVIPVLTPALAGAASGRARRVLVALTGAAAIIVAAITSAFSW
jgi:polysaccharide chain length determinant protein (PEP-CTERM system associated)